MFDHLFENRNTTVTNLLKIGDCIGRSLRENLEIFSIDGDENKVAYLTESGNVLTGRYAFGEKLTLTDINIQEADVFTDNDKFDTLVDERVSSFVGRVNESDFSEAGEQFAGILSLWESRLKFETTKKKLEEKVSAFSENQNILGTETFDKFIEILPQFREFLKENKDSIEQVKEVENAVKLSNSVSRAFDLPFLTCEDLLMEGKYEVSRDINHSIYELICKQELVKKELLESRRNFNDVWATNPKIRAIAGLIFEEDQDKILETLVEAVLEVPFLALTTKKQLTESIENAMSLTEQGIATTKELKGFVANLYEMKKPIKEAILRILNEKYGINVQTLKETATFSNLADTQVVIFETLSRLAPKGSVLKGVLSEMSGLLKDKNGVEVIDVNDFLQECFEECGLTAFLDDLILIEDVSLEDILESDLTPAQLLEKAKEVMVDKAKEAEDAILSPEQKKKKENAEKAEDETDQSSEEDMEDDSIRKAERKEGCKEEVSEPANEETYIVDEESETEGEVDTVEDEEVEEPEAKPLSKEEFLDALADVDSLAKNLSDDEPEEDIDEE